MRGTHDAAHRRTATGVHFRGFEKDATPERNQSYWRVPTCSVRETYADSEAVLAHLANVGRLFGQLATMSTFEFEVFGTPPDELKAATKELSIKTYTYFQGLES